MPSRPKPRKLEVYALHCKNEAQQVDYRAVFQELQDTPFEVRQMQVGDKLVALPGLAVHADSVELVAYEGPVGVNPLIFDAATGDERYEALADDQIMATRTYAIIDLDHKEAIVEFNQRGAKARDIAEIIEETGRRIGLGNQFSVELVPSADKSFLEALDRFGRIKVARLKVVEPNFDWHDNYENMNVIGSQSNARVVELVAIAKRNDTLSKSEGAVQYIRQMISSGIRNLKGASIEGVRVGETADTSISLANYVEHQKVSVRVDQHGHVLGSEIQEKLRAFLVSRQQARRQT